MLGLLEEIQHKLDSKIRSYHHTLGSYRFLTSYSPCCGSFLCFEAGTGNNMNSTRLPYLRPAGYSVDDYTRKEVGSTVVFGGAN